MLSTVSALVLPESCSDETETLWSGEILPLAPVEEVLNVQEKVAGVRERQRLKDEHTLRELRICLSSILHELHKDKRFAVFWRPGAPALNVTLSSSRLCFYNELSAVLLL